MSVYPLKFKPMLFAKVWGHDEFAVAYGKLPEDGIERSQPIGESWELADFGEHRSVIANGPHEGRTLQDVIRQYGSAFLGDLQLTPEGGFPLLVKFLFTNAPLSVQVHPREEWLAAHPEAGRLKNEAWYILDAGSESWIMRGLKEPTDARTIREHVQSGTLQDLLRAIRPIPGRCYFVPAGTVHAIGPQLSIVEIQTPSDSTFRLFDWGRTDRELHIDQSLESMTFEPTDVTENERRSHIGGVFTAVSKICDCPHFRIEKVRMFEGYGQEIPYNRPAVWVVLEGEAVISKTPAGVDVLIGGGDVVLLPAGMDDARIDFNANTTWLEVQFPTLLEDELLA